MFGEEHQLAQLIFPTERKERIASYLSWPLGAKALSAALSGCTQASRLALEFRDQWPKFHQGKWPSRFPVLEVKYLRHRNVHQTGEQAKPHWSLCIRAVPREMKSRVAETLQSQGLGDAAKWLDRNAGMFGREGRVTLVILWDSTSNSLNYDVRGIAVPEVTTDAALRRKKEEEGTV